MARLGVSKKKKSPRATELSQLKKELKRVTEQLESCQRELESSNTELRESREQETTTGEILRVIASAPTDLQPVFRQSSTMRSASVRRKTARCSDLMES